MRPEKSVPVLKHLGFRPVDRIEGDEPGEVATMYLHDWGAKVDRRALTVSEIKDF